MIVGIGVDVTQVSRLEDALARNRGLAERLFTKQEQLLPDGKPRSVTSLAGRFAAKEALAKALGSSELSWLDAEVLPGTGQPRLELHGTARELADQLGVRMVHLSISHDAGVAMAFVVCEA
jgi:holo-[acyl-carrier protein] synthase